MSDVTSDVAWFSSDVTWGVADVTSDAVKNGRPVVMCLVGGFRHH